MPELQRIAIVNRGEPAMRLVRAVRDLNIERGQALRTIALHTQPDRNSLYVREADEAYFLGPATVPDGRGGTISAYVDQERLRRALIETKADAVWVGWGFVAENPDFAQLVEELGLVFIGPPSQVMRTLSDKVAAKRLAEQAGVPVAAWSGGPIEDLERGRQCARDLGYPLLIKAAAGGGGRGIRRVLEPSQLAEAFERARAEALSAFGDGTVFFESLIEDARHVEVQILADQHGTTWAVGVRDCSLQRRSQKIVEEGPCPVLNDQQDAQIRAAAVRLAAAAGYVNAGTVEFLYVPASGQFYFMEMNARLQVEHPVTEVTTGLDLVKLQLHVAGGGRLEGEPPRTVGHAIEVRLNAEDPAQGFSPSPGQLSVFRMPAGPGIRVDTGVAEGDDVPEAFDSMIAKIIARGRDRGEALARMRRALLECAVMVSGGTTNRAFLLDTLGQPDVVAGVVDTRWVDRFVTRWGGRPHATIAPALLQAAIEVYEAQAADERADFVRSALAGRPAVSAAVGRKVDLSAAGQAYSFVICQIGPSEYRVEVDGRSASLIVQRRGTSERWLTYAGQRYHLFAQSLRETLLIEVEGRLHRVASDDGGTVRAPTPGVVLGIDVAEGDIVSPGDRLVVLEAMKMETAVVAPMAARVRRVLVRAHMQVAPGSALVLLESVSEESVGEVAPRIELASQEDHVEADGDDEVARVASIMVALIKGYEIDSDTAAAFGARLAALQQRFEPADDRLVGLEDELLRLFVDIFGLFARSGTEGSEVSLAAEEHLADFLRTPGRLSAADPRFDERLRAAVGRYGVSSLDRGPRLYAALLRIRKANVRADRLVVPLVGILERRLAHYDRLREGAGAAFRELLDQLIEVSDQRFMVLYDLAHQVHYRYFEQQLTEQARNEVYRQLESIMSGLVRDPDSPDREQGVQAIVSSPHPIIGFLCRWIGAEDERVRRLVLELQVRRFYDTREVRNLRTVELNGAIYAMAELIDEGAEAQIIAALTDFEALPQAVLGSHALQAGLAPYESVIWDYFVVYPGSEASPDALAEQLAAYVDPAGLGRPPDRVCFCLMNDRRERGEHYFTFRPSGRTLQEVAQFRGMHQMWAERLELWRLSEFDLEPLPAAEDIYLYLAQARQNPADERLLALVDVRDLTPVHDEHGEIGELPLLEHQALETLAAMRAIQYRRPSRARLQWNRILFYLWPTVTFESEVLWRVLSRLAPAARNLGLEKFVVRARIQGDADAKPVDRSLHFAFSLEQVGRFRVSDPSPFPIRTLTRYQQRVVRLRARGLAYPYEIIRWLTAREADAVVFPPGRFSEYDLDSGGALVPVERPFGENRANLVVGIIENTTAKFPEGMRRVMLLGDPSREMGALAEPECRRIVAALELAAKLRVPLEWFPISAGAKISLDSGTENLDWTARVLRAIVEFTQAGGEINLIVAGVNVGAQSYWNAEATMLMHTRGILVMTPNASMVLTGKRALDYSGSVSADNNHGIGGADSIMGPNGQAQYVARDFNDACLILLRHYEQTYVMPGERFPRRAATADASDRDITEAPHDPGDPDSFATVGDIFSAATNAARKRPFDIRAVLSAVVDVDHSPMERWALMQGAEIAVVWEANLGGLPVCLVGIESKPLQRFGFTPGDGPKAWNGGTLFPGSSKKVARAINAASGNRPLVMLANLSGFDGSPESMRTLQLEFGAEIGRSVVNFRGPIVFCVVSRYHGGAYVVFSSALNEQLEVAAIEGSYASVIGGAPAAAVVLTREVNAKVYADPRVQELRQQMALAEAAERKRLVARLKALINEVSAEYRGQVAEEFDQIHSVERARSVGSIHRIIPAKQLRPYLIEAVERGMARELTPDIVAQRPHYDG